MTSVRPSSSSDQTPILKPPPVVVKDPFAPAVVPSASLQTLDQIGTLKIRRNKNLYSAMSQVELPNRYFILDENDRQVFIGHESSDKFCRCFFGRDRAFTISVLDENNSGLVRICKDFSPASSLGCSCFDCGHSAEISDKEGQHLGSIVQILDPVFPSFQIRNSKDQALYDIISKPMGCCMPWLCWKRTGHFFLIYRPGSNYEIGYMGTEDDVSNSSFVQFPEKANNSERVLLMGALVQMHVMFFTNICGCE